jgi:outer membrane protein OmpA-like peptidoglycan-associated protein
MNSSQKSNGDHWISISDMMSGLMMVFLFIAISYMINVVKEKDKIKEIAVTYNRLQSDLYVDLNKAFKDKLETWGADIDRQSLAITFNSPEVLFQKDSYTIQPRFKEILNEFFPKYIEILSSDKYRQDIEEIRIEGHTSSEATNLSIDRAYYYNMRLSQDRTRSVLEYVLELPTLKSNKDWLRKNLTANGLSSSKIVMNVGGTEDRLKSRRVEFRVRTNAEKRIVKIISE